MTPFLCVAATTFTWMGSEDRFWGNSDSWSGGDVAYPDGVNHEVAINNDFIQAALRSPILMADAAGNDISVTICGWSQNGPSSGNREYIVQNVTDGTGALILKDTSDDEVLLSTYNASRNYTQFKVLLMAHSNVRLHANGNSGGTKLFISGGLIEAEENSVSLSKTGAYDAAIESCCEHSGGTYVHLGKLIVSFEGTLGTGDVKIEGGTLELANTEGSIDDEAKLVIAAGAKVMLHDNVNVTMAPLLISGGTPGKAGSVVWDQWVVSGETRPTR
jgi:hypothetical protein